MEEAYSRAGHLDTEPLGALPWVVQCCLFLGPDCSYNLQDLE